MQAASILKKSGLRLFGVVVALTLAAACGGESGTIEYKDGKTALFQVPADWHVYEADELASIQGRPFVTNFGTQLAILNEVGFDGAPGKNVTNLDAPVAAVEYPVGTYVVRSIGSVEKEAISRALLENAILWPEAFDVSEQSLVDEDFSFGDFEGIRRVLSFQDSASEAEGLVYFITVTDPTDTRIFSMAAGCSRACWEIHGDDIVGVVDSWLVNTRQ